MVIKLALYSFYAFIIGLFLYLIFSLISSPFRDLSKLREKRIHENSKMGSMSKAIVKGVVVVFFISTAVYIETMSLETSFYVFVIFGVVWIAGVLRSYEYYKKKA